MDHRRRGQRAQVLTRFDRWSFRAIAIAQQLGIERLNEAPERGDYRLPNLGF